MRGIKREAPGPCLESVVIKRLLPIYYLNIRLKHIKLQILDNIFTYKTGDYIYFN